MSIQNRWGGERISLANDTPTNIIQVHLSRYVWAMHYCTGKRVLDAGCGIGYGSWLLGTVAAEVVGIDSSDAALAAAKSAFDGLFICLPIEEAPAQITTPFETIVAFEVVEHLTDMQQGLTALKSMLAPDGVAVISLPLHHPSEFHHRRDMAYEDWVGVVSEQFVIRDTFWQGLEEYQRQDGNVNIRRLVDGTPNTGIVIFEVAASE